MIHLSARLAWHDSGWNSCVYRHPYLTLGVLCKSKSGMVATVH